jgi:hypothetical protein
MSDLAGTLPIKLEKAMTALPHPPCKKRGPELALVVENTG